MATIKVTRRPVLVAAHSCDTGHTLDHYQELQQLLHANHELKTVQTSEELL